MGHSHPSTPAERAQWAKEMLAHDHEYGFITHLSSAIKVSRPTLYAWKAQACQALQQAFLDTTATTSSPVSLEHQILTLLIEGHNSYANIQTCLRTLTGRQVSIGTISAVVTEAQKRAQLWMATHAPTSTRTLALDEIYATNRCGAYLNVVDCDSWAVWAAEGPLPVDSESWTLLLWLAHERGLQGQATVSDGGDALRSACQAVDPQGCHQRDVWHLFHFFNQVLGRIARRLQALQEQTATVERQAARLAAGRAARGGRPRTDLVAHLAEVEQVERIESELRILGQELQRVLAVVVLDARGVQDLARRRQELSAWLELLWELQAQALAPLQRELGRLHSHVRLAQEAALAFVVRLDAVQQDMMVVLGSEGVSLIGWAWQRREVLEMDVAELVAALPSGWRPTRAPTGAGA